MQLSRKGWTHFLWLWLMLATVLTHALLPFGSPLTRQSGSAFSALTSDVAVSRTGRTQVQTSKLQPRASPDDLDLGDGGTAGEPPLAAPVAPSKPFVTPHAAVPPPFPVAAPEALPEACCRLAYPARAPPAA